MNQTADSADPAVAEPVAPVHRLNEVVKLVKMELLSGRATGHDRGTGCNPYDQGSQRDVWGKRRRA
jgi:hypothetical protein